MLDFILGLIVVVVVGPPVFINTVGPLIIWRTQKLPAIVKFESIDNDIFDQQRNVAFHHYDQAITALGFEVIGSSVLKDSQIDSHFRLYWNPMLKIAATTVTILSKIEENTYMEFSQKFRDGSVLDVSNSATPEAYPKLDFKSAFRFPKLQDAGELLATHIKLASGLKNQLSPVDMDVARGFGAIEDFLKIESDALLEKGIVKADIDEDGKRRLTLYGAFVLTYKSVFPGKNLFGYLSEQNAKKIVKSVTT